MSSELLLLLLLLTLTLLVESKAADHRGGGVMDLDGAPCHCGAAVPCTSASRFGEPLEGGALRGRCSLKNDRHELRTGHACQSMRIMCTGCNETHSPLKLHCGCYTSAGPPCVTRFVR